MGLVPMVAVTMLRVVALRTGPVTLTQLWWHPLLARDVVGLHEGHARQHCLAAQQPRLAKTQRACQGRIERSLVGLLTQAGSQGRDGEREAERAGRSHGKEQRNALASWLWFWRWGDFHWPISYGLEQSCWNGVSSPLFECVCVWVRTGGVLQSGLGNNRRDHQTHPNHRGPKPESEVTVKHFFLHVQTRGLASLRRFLKNHQFWTRFTSGKK